MDKREMTGEMTEGWKTKTLIAGVALGALVGLGGAYLLVQNAEKRGVKLDLSAKEGLKLSLLLMGLLRQVSKLGDDD